MTASDLPEIKKSRETAMLIVFFIAAGFVFLDRFGISYLFPQIGKSLHLDESQLASLVSITAVAWAISSLIFSVLSDRIGHKKLMIVASILLFSVALGLIGLSPNYGIMLLLRAIIGFCAGPAVPIMQSLVSQSSPASRRGRNLGIVIAGTSVIGTALAPTIMIGLSTAYGWRLTFPIVATAGLVVAILVAVFYKAPPAIVGAVQSVRFRDFRTVIANRNVLLAVLGTIIMIGFVIGFSAFAPQFLTEKGLSPAGVTLVLTVFGISTALGNIIAPFVSDRIGRKPTLIIAAICAGLTPLFFVLFSASVPLLLVGSLMALLGGGALTLITYVVPSESVAPSLIASAFALQIAVGETIGGAFGPQIGGALADSTHTLSSALLLYAAAPIVVVVLALFLRETAPRRTAAKTKAIEEIEIGTQTLVP